MTYKHKHQLHKHQLFREYKHKHQLFREYKSGLVSYNVIKNRFESCRGDIRETWKNIIKFMAKGRDTSNIVLRDEQGNEHSDPEYVADTFVDYFSSVAVDLDDNILSYNINPLDYVGNPIDFSYFAFPSTADEVKSLIMSLPNKKCNCDDVPILVYKLLVDRISIMIRDIFNRSLQEGVFPDRLKLSYIQPLFKALDRFSFQNYRPITSLHLLSKLLEKRMNRRLNNYLDKHSLTLYGPNFFFRRFSGHNLR